MANRGNYIALSSASDSHTGKVIPEGFEQLITSANNILAFHGVAEREAYRNNPANAAQLGASRGNGDTRGH